MKVLTFFLALVVLGGCSARHSAVSSTYDFSHLKRIAVAGFDNSGTQLSGVEDMVTRALLEKGFSVVERSELDRLIKEQKIGAQGYLSADTARELGKIMGVDGFMMGKISSYTPEKEDVVMIEASSTRMTVNPAGGGGPHHGNPPGGGADGRPQPQQGPTTSMTTTMKRIPHVYTKYAQAGLTMRLVDTQTGEVAWAASYTTEGVNGAAAAEYAADYLVDTFYRDMQKQVKAAKAAR